MKNFKKLFYAFNLFVLFLAILSCAEDAPSTEDVNTDCVADEVAATSTTEKNRRCPSSGDKIVFWWVH